MSTATEDPSTKVEGASGDEQSTDARYPKQSEADNQADVEMPLGSDPADIEDVDGPSKWPEEDEDDEDGDEYDDGKDEPGATAAPPLRKGRGERSKKQQPTTVGLAEHQELQRQLDAEKRRGREARDRARKKSREADAALVARTQAAMSHADRDVQDAMAACGLTPETVVTREAAEKASMVLDVSRLAKSYNDRNVRTAPRHVVPPGPARPLNLHQHLVARS